MNPTVTLVAYRAKPGAAGKLPALIRRHGRTLRAQGLHSERPQLVLELADGCFLEICEWKSDAHAAKAHENPEVLKIWEEASGLADFVGLAQLPGANQPFPKMKALGAKARGQIYADNMVSAKNFGALVSFYRDLLGLEPVAEAEDFSTLEDPQSGQRLCITNGQASDRLSVGVSVENIESTIADLEARGGRVVRRWEYAKMIGCNAADPEGNEILIWQSR